MKARHQCIEGRTARFNLPVCRRSRLRLLTDLLLAPPLRLHRYRNLTTKMVENTLDNADRGRCK
jgi:hypothetical protein